MTIDYLMVPSKEEGSAFDHKRSDAIPHSVDEKNCRREKSEPIIPKGKCLF